jgi:hypothetical protein
MEYSQGSFVTRTIRGLVLLPLLIVAPGICQVDETAYFTLNSAKTFAPGETPSINFTAWNVKQLEFRVYRVNDPVRFFEQLEDAHTFGGGIRRKRRNETWVERLHTWKHSLRRDIRASLRGQFSESPSAHLGPAENAVSKKPAATPGTEFAILPVLNSDQLVLKFVQPVQATTRWDSRKLDIGIKDKGVYLVEAAHGELAAYTILFVSDLAMVTKNAFGRVQAFVANRTTGEPVRDADLHLLTRGNSIQTLQTDANGFAQTDVRAEPEQDVRILARAGSDVAVTVLPSYVLSHQRESLMGYTYTDRPVYRPGHSVHFKSILRVSAAQGYETPKDREVSVEIRDPDGKPAYQTTLRTSGMGTVQDEFTLPSNAALGNYFIELRAGENSAYQSFTVEEYKKPEYEVRVTPAKSRVLQGEKMQAAIEARYYFGEPVKDAKVTWSVYRSRYWLFYMDEIEEPSGIDDEDLGENEEIWKGEGRLDSEGKLNISLPTDVSEKKFDFRYRIEARVTDESRREISGTGYFLATYGSLLVNVFPERYVVEPSTRASFRIETRDYDNQPAHAPVHLEVLRDASRNEVLASADVLTGDDGNARAELNIPSEGREYIVRASAPSGSRRVEGVAYIWASGGAGGYYTASGKTVRIVPDQKTYKTGDTAHVLVVTGGDRTPVYITVETRSVRLSKVIRSSGATALIDVPVTSSDEPGFYVSAQFFRGGDLYQSSKRISVPPRTHELNIALSTDQPTYLPGQAATYNIAVTTIDGRPSPGTDVSLGIVDEAIYAIHKETAQDMVKFFFGDQGSGVFTENSLTYYFYGEAGKRRMQLAALRPSSKLAQLKPERLIQPKVRKLFPDTAFWAPDLITDARGRAQAKVSFPDSLTSWRATARAISPDQRVGRAVLKTIVRKNVILRLAMPRFFVQGDEVVVSALVHNYLPSTKTAHVSLNVKGLQILNGGTRDIEIPSRGDARADWRVKALTAGTAAVQGQALTDQESDATEVELPVNPAGIRLSMPEGGALAAGDSRDFKLTFPQHAEPNSRSISIHVAPSIAGSLFGALSYLTSYPYGCVEQTMSSFLPDVIVKKAVIDLGLQTNLDNAELQRKIQAGLDRLYSFQHDDGGWGWWTSDESHSFMTAYVTSGLVEARAAGVTIRPAALAKGAAWITKALSNRDIAPDLRTYMVRALFLAGEPNRTALDSTYADRTRLSPFGLAVLGLTLEIAKDPRAASVSSALEAQAKRDSAQAWWPATRDELLDFDADATPEATAFAVELISHQNSQSPLLPRAALWLMNHRSEGYWWSSTKQTAMVIYGLTDYLKASRELNPDVTATVLVNDREVLSQHFGSPTDAKEIRLDESKISSGENRVRIRISGSGRVYYSMRAEYFSSDERLQKTGQLSLNLLRDYFRLVPKKQGDRFVYNLNTLDGPVASGDVLAVRLTVTGTDWKYLMVEDPIPAGTEFIERDNLYELASRPPWWQYSFTRRELHDNRMAIFQTYFQQGQQQYFYLLKVVNPGVFHVSPARVEPMYQPEFLSSTESRVLEVR